MTAQVQWSEPLGIEVRHLPGCTVLQLRGEVDAYSASRLREQLLALAAEGRHTLVVDAAGIEFLDSSGMGVLVGAYKRGRGRGGALLVATPPPYIAKMLAITGLDKVFGVFDSLEAALEHLAHRADGGRR